MKEPNAELQQKLLSHVQVSFEHFDTLLRFYRKKWFELFRATYVFETDRRGVGQSQIFFPKAFAEVEKVGPRITGNSPKFVLGLNQPTNQQTPDANMLENVKAAQMGLNYFWKIGNCQKKSRSWVKSGLVYGTSWAKVDFKVKTIKLKEKKGTVNKDGEISIKETEIEKNFIEYPTFEAIDILDMWFDPRVDDVDEMTGVIENKDDVRLADILSKKDEYFNLDKLQDVSGQYAWNSNSDNYKLNKFNVQGVPTFNSSQDNKTNYKVYHGYFSETGEPEDEKLVEITIVADSIVIGYKEIGFLPFEKFNPIEIPQQGVGMGLVEPIKKIQDAYNLTRNQRFENVSMVINRMWKVKKGAGLDLRRVKSAAGHMIPVRDMQDIEPLVTPDVTGSAYNEAQSLNTDIQTALGTIDTTQDSSSNGFTDLATGQKIRWNEYNVRFKAIKGNFEEALSRLGEKMLMMVGQEANQDPVIQDQVTQEFFAVARTAFDQTSDYYSVNVLADSTAMDSIDNEREEALGFGNLAIAYKAQQVPVNLTKVWDDIDRSFQKDPNDYNQPAPQPAEGEAPSGKGVSEEEIQEAMPQTPADELNKQLTNV